MALNIVDSIPVSKRLKAKTAIFTYKPNAETKADPNWVDPEDGSVPPQVPAFTDREWADEIVWRFLKKCYFRGETMIADQAADKLIDIR